MAKVIAHKVKQKKKKKKWTLDGKLHDILKQGKPTKLLGNFVQQNKNCFHQHKQINIYCNTTKGAHIMENKTPWLIKKKKITSLPNHIIIYQNNHTSCDNLRRAHLCLTSMHSWTAGQNELKTAGSTRGVHKEVLGGKKYSYFQVSGRVEDPNSMYVNVYCVVPLLVF